MTKKQTMKIHPIIIHSCCSKEEKNSNEIPICPNQIKEKEGQKTTEGEEEKSLEQFRSILKELIESDNVSNPRYYPEFKLDADDKYLYSSIDQLLKKAKIKISFNPFQRIIICCPLYYLSSNTFQDKKSKFNKLIFKFKTKALKGHYELVDFYDQYADTLTQREDKLFLYTNMENAALLWLDLVKAIFKKKTLGQTEDTLVSDEGSY